MKPLVGSFPRSAASTTFITSGVSTTLHLLSLLALPHCFPVHLPLLTVLDVPAVVVVLLPAVSAAFCPRGVGRGVVIEESVVFSGWNGFVH